MYGNDYKTEIIDIHITFLSFKNTVGFQGNYRNLPNSFLVIVVTSEILILSEYLNLIEA